MSWFSRESLLAEETPTMLKIYSKRGHTRSTCNIVYLLCSQCICCGIQKNLLGSFEQDRSFEVLLSTQKQMLKLVSKIITFLLIQTYQGYLWTHTQYKYILGQRYGSNIAVVLLVYCYFVCKERLLLVFIGSVFQKDASNKYQQQMFSERKENNNKNVL